MESTGRATDRVWGVTDGGWRVPDGGWRVTVCPLKELPNQPFEMLDPFTVNAAKDRNKNIGDGGSKQENVVSEGLMGCLWGSVGRPVGKSGCTHSRELSAGNGLLTEPLGATPSPSLSVLLGSRLVSKVVAKAVAGALPEPKGRGGGMRRATRGAHHPTPLAVKERRTQAVRVERIPDHEHERRRAGGCHKDTHPFFFLYYGIHSLMFGGYPPTAIGYPPTAIGYTPTAIGYPPAASGYPPTAIGYTPTAIGYPPAASGYPPAAIVGRIGHSEFFFSFSLRHPLMQRLQIRSLGWGLQVTQKGGGDIPARGTILPPPPVPWTVTVRLIVVRHVPFSV